MLSQPLEEITVLDFSQLTQGPWAAQKLGDMGAEVIKIERPGTGEIRRHTEAAGRQIGREAPQFLSVNRSKKGLTLNLKSDRGRELCLELAETADVVLHNFRPGVMEGLGLSYEEFKEAREDIIFVESTGYGRTGPYVDKPGQDLLMQSMAGIAAITGRRDDPPTPVGMCIVDYHAAMLLAYGITLALFHRERTGDGQRVDLNLLNAALDMQPHELVGYMNTDIPLERSEEGVSMWMTSAPYGLYETADGYIALSNVSPRDLVTIGEIAGLPELGEYSEAEHYSKRDEIKRTLETVTQTKSTNEWLELFEAEDLWCAPVQTYEDIVDDPQVEHNNMIVTVEDEDGNDLKMPGVPLEFSKSPGAADQGPPGLGEHNNQILTELGYSQAEIEELRATEVI